MNLILGNNKIKLKELSDNSVDSIVTDPPYGLSFMGKKWDYDVPDVETWKECLRVLKPGGYLLAFAGTRTQHRMAVNIEDAGFEIRDMIAWVYGSGFPKSHNISKSIDKNKGADREIIGTTKGKSGENLNKLSRENTNDSDTATSMGAYGIGAKQITVDIPVTAPATDEAKQWEGWGTALKPALEPITMARKPLSENTIAENVLRHGTGGINIDASRVPTEETIENHSRSAVSAKGKIFVNSEQETHQTTGQQLGRFPANFIHDGSDEVIEIFPNNNPSCKSPSSATPESKYRPGQGNYQPQGTIYPDDTGTSASRFFYCPKASKTDRNEGLDDFDDNPSYMVENGSKSYENSDGGNRTDRTTVHKNNHPTVKPTELMKYLVKLVTPEDGIVLDPFMGSGSTGKACKQLGYDFIGMELDEDYFKIAEARIYYAVLDGETPIEPKQKENIDKFFDI